MISLRSCLLLLAGGLLAVPLQARAEGAPPAPAATTVQLVEISQPLCLARGVLRCLLGLERSQIRLVLVGSAPTPPPRVVLIAPAVASPAVVGSADEPRPGDWLTLGMSVQSHRLGSGLGGSLRVEGRRLGLSLTSLQLYSPEGIGGGWGTARSLHAVHLSWSLLAGERGRLRVEGGASAAVTPTDLVLGPELGTSADLRLLGPFGVSGGLFMRPFPLKQIEVRGSLFVEMSIFRADVGIRRVRVEQDNVLPSLLWIQGFGDLALGLALAL